MSLSAHAALRDSTPPDRFGGVAGTAQPARCNAETWAACATALTQTLGLGLVLAQRQEALPENFTLRLE